MRRRLEDQTEQRGSGMDKIKGAHQRFVTEFGLELFQTVEKLPDF